MIWTWLLLLPPAALALRYWLHAGPLWVFVAGALAIVPLAEWVRRATEQIAKRAGPAIGGLVNVTFGNAAELILALFVLHGGEPAVVKGQITGSIIANSLLGLGLAVLAGAQGRPRQTFRREQAGRLGSLLILTTIGLLVPALFDYAERGLLDHVHRAGQEEHLSLAVSVVFILVYAANLVYTLVTRRDVYADPDGPDEAAGGWSWGKALGVLAVATAAIAWEADLISSSLTSTAGRLGVTPFFLGVTVLAVIGNAAEFVAGMYFARQGRMGLVLTTMVGSSIQVALLVAPLLVIVSYFLGSPMNLVFGSPLELIAIAAVAFGVNAIARDGETDWFEGVLLISVYALLALAFYFVVPGP